MPLYHSATIACFGHLGVRTLDFVQAILSVSQEAAAPLLAGVEYLPGGIPSGRAGA